MPNWCMNNLDISHDNEMVVKNMIARLEAMEQDDYGDYNGLLRCLDPRYEYREACYVDWTETDDGISISFSTAWEPPIEVYEELENQEWQVNASFYEPGLDFAGWFDEGGECRVNNLSEKDDDWFEEDPVGKIIQDQWDILADRESWLDEEDQTEYE